MSGSTATLRLRMLLVGGAPLAIFGALAAVTAAGLRLVLFWLPVVAGVDVPPTLRHSSLAVLVLTLLAFLLYVGVRYWRGPGVLPDAVGRTRVEETSRLGVKVRDMSEAVGVAPPETYVILLVVRSLNRQREFAADETAAWVTTPDAMARALQRLGRGQTESAFEDGGLNALALSAPRSTGLLSTHPPIEARIARLRER